MLQGRRFSRATSVFGFVLATLVGVEEASAQNAQGQNAYGTIVAGNSGKCIDVPNGSTNDNIQIQQFQCDNSPKQSFTFVAVGGGYYKIVAGHSGKCLNVHNGSSNNYESITQANCNKKRRQKFLFSAFTPPPPFVNSWQPRQYQQQGGGNPYNPNNTGYPNNSNNTGYPAPPRNK